MEFLQIVEKDGKVKIEPYTGEKDNKYLISAEKHTIRYKKAIVRTYLQSVNGATYNHIIQNKDSYPQILIVFTETNQLNDNVLKDVLLRNEGRWHVAGDPLNTFGMYARNEPNATQGWYSKRQLIELMMERVIPKYAWIIKQEIEYL